MTQTPSTIIAILLLLFLTASHAYPSSGLAKNTYAASDPLSCYQWFYKYLPIGCQDSMNCNTTYGCGTSGRARFCDSSELDSNNRCATPTFGAGNGFGLHTVNMSARAIDVDHSLEMVEAKFDAEFRAAVMAHKYSAFMDYATVMYATDLDSYITAFKAGGEMYLLVKWYDETGTAYYSVVVKSCGQIIFELVSSKMPTVDTDFVEDSLVRLHSSTFSNNEVSQQADHVLTILAVSKPVSDHTAVDAFYVDIMESTRVHNSTSDDGVLYSYGIGGSATALLRFIQRTEPAVLANFSVAALETVKKNTRQMFRMDEFCGADKWYDNHFAASISPSVTLDTVVSRLDAAGEKTYHIFGGVEMSEAQLYVGDPTGDSFQVNGQWSSMPVNGSGGSIKDPCSLGACGKYSVTYTCKSAVLATCGALQYQDKTCTSCMYNNWASLAKAGCTVADISNYCIDQDTNCANRCDANTLYCSNQNCESLVKTYSCDKFYSYKNDGVYAGWCDKECSVGSCENQFAS